MANHWKPYKVIFTPDTNLNKCEIHASNYILLNVSGYYYLYYTNVGFSLYMNIVFLTKHENTLNYVLPLQEKLLM